MKQFLLLVVLFPPIREQDTKHQEQINSHADKKPEVLPFTAFQELLDSETTGQNEKREQEV
jgi:hypothetical protein